MVLPKAKPFQGLFHTEVGGPVITKDDSEFEAVVDRWSQFARQQGEGPEDRNKFKSFALENIVRIGREQGYEDEEIKKIILRINKADGGRVPLKKGKSPMPSDKTTSQLLDINFDDYTIEDWIDMLKSVGAYQGGGRVPLKGGKLALLQGLGKIMDEFFPGTTKLGKTSKPLAKKTQLKKAVADFQEREKAAKSKITSHAGVLEKAGEGRFTKAEVLKQMFENTIKQSKSANTKKRFTNFSKEIESKPELANDPKVWNFFTGELPKNQKLVVYGDDTVDFWRQSEFGPHNIKTTDKFMKKHPHLSREQAIKIQNMEPEDQIFEMKKIEALRKKGMHASGGLAGMLGE
jgi:predicted transcriptional regulator